MGFWLLFHISPAGVWDWKQRPTELLAVTYFSFSSPLELHTDQRGAVRSSSLVPRLTSCQRAPGPSCISPEIPQCIALPVALRQQMGKLHLCETRLPALTQNDDDSQVPQTSVSCSPPTIFSFWLGFPCKRKTGFHIYTVTVKLDSASTATRTVCSCGGAWPHCRVCVVLSRNSRDNWIFHDSGLEITTPPLFLSRGGKH